MNLSKASHTLYFILTIVLISGCSHQLKISKRAGVLAGQLQHWYDNESLLWETTSWWNGANALTALIRYGQLTNTDSLVEVLENTFLKTKQFKVPATENTKAWFCTAYINDHYDDEGWWALAWLDAWEWTGNQEYLAMARTGPVNGKSCLQWSVDIWNWMLSVKLINEEGLLQDGVGGRRGDCKINPRVWTYNQGVILSGLVFLSQNTGDKKYLNQADSITVAAINNMVNDAGVLYEINCEPAGCNGDAEQFKGIFMRHLALLHQYSPKEEYGEFIALNAQSILENAMQNGSVPPGVSWSIFSEKSNAATVSSALDALNAASSD